MTRIRLAFITIIFIAVSATSTYAADDRVKIGVLTDMNGPYSAVTGKGSVVAAELAVEDFGGKALGKSIEVVSADHQQRPDIGSAIAMRWFDNEGVDAIFDGAGSSVALGILNIAKARNKIAAFSGVISPDVTGKFCGETISSWAWDTQAIIGTIVKSILRSGGKRFFFITLDAAVGAALQTDATKIIEANGGAVVGSVRHPINTQDFSSFLLQAQSAKPDVVILANAGADTVNSLKQAAEFGLSRTMNVAALLAMINNIESLGLEFSQGTVVAESFYWDMNDATRAWAKRFKDRLGVNPNMLQAAVYSATLHYLKAVEKVGKTDGLTVAAAMKTTPINDMYSKNVLLRADGRAVRDFFLFEVKRKAESKGPWDDYKMLQTLPGIEAFPASTACQLVK